ncbi:hypothetical protein FAGKG844_910004 [Frankia sp. AgKG'84/4]
MDQAPGTAQRGGDAEAEIRPSERHTPGRRALLITGRPGPADGRAIRATRYAAGRRPSPLCVGARTGMSQRCAGVHRPALKTRRGAS